jgi:O-antigen ligase
MLSEQHKLDHYKTTLFTIFTCLWFVGIIAGEKAPAVLSITMIGQLLSVLLLTHPKKLWNNFINNKAMALFSLSFLFLLLSFFYSDNLRYLGERLQIKIPILLYALIWPSIGVLSKQQFKIIFYSLIGVCVISAGGILTNYALHFEEINQLYLQSKIMPGPINHIRYSLLIVFAICVIYYYIKQQYTGSKTEKKLLVAAALFLILFLHIYSVRSGLLTLYAVIAIGIINQVIATKNYKQVGVAVGALIGIVMISLAISPTMRNKLINTKQDVNVYTNHEDPNYNSLATRMVSYKTALEIAKENIWLGCGQGDLRDKNDALFKRDYPSIITPIIPHNQFIYYLAATGLIGLIIFSFAFTAPIWVNKFYRLELMQFAYAILLIAFQFEAMLESQIGMACTLLMIMIPYYLCTQQKKTTV